MKGAFARGTFDITRLVKPGAVATLAVLVHPQPNPGIPIEHTIANGMGKNGGIATGDGPTFLCTLGWDWIPGIRDRDTGIWQKVFLSTTGPVRIDEPFVTSDLSLPRMDSADMKVQVTLKNGSDQPQKGTLKGTIGENSSAPDYAAFQQSVEVPPNSSKVLTLDPSTTSRAATQKPQALVAQWLWRPKPLSRSSLLRYRWRHLGFHHL